MEININKIENLDTNCSICLEDIIYIKNKKTLKCEHMFHKDCINNYFKIISNKTSNNLLEEQNSNNTLNLFCPICKTRVKEDKQFNENISLYNFNLRKYKNYYEIFIVFNRIQKRLLRFLSTTDIIFLLESIDINTIISGSFLLSIIYDDISLITNEIDILVDSIFSYNKLLIFLSQLSNYTINEINLLDINKSINIIQHSIFTNSNNPNIKINLIFNTDNLLCINFLYPLELYKLFYNGKFYSSNYTKILYMIDYIKKRKLNDLIKKEITFLEKNNFKITILD